MVTWLQKAPSEAGTFIEVACTCQLSINGTICYPIVPFIFTNYENWKFMRKKILIVFYKIS